MLVVKGKLAYRHTPEEVRRDFEQFRAMAASDLVERRHDWTTRSDTCPTPRRLFLYRPIRTGQMLSDYFHWRHMIRTRVRGKASAVERLDTFQRDRKSFERTRKRSAKYFSAGVSKEAQDAALVRQSSALLTLTHFRASVSKHLCDTHGSRRVLDFSAGWGDRLTGFLASQSVQKITLIDPRPSSIRECIRQHAFVRSDKELVTHQDGAEVVLPTLRANSYDLIITSPPYFDLEEYGDVGDARDSRGQIRNKVSTTDGYLRSFLVPVLRHCARVLAPGGILAINVDDNPNSEVELCQSVINTLRSIPSLTFMGTAGLRKGSGFGGAVKRSVAAEPIYLFQSSGRMPRG